MPETKPNQVKKSNCSVK